MRHIWKSSLTIAGQLWRFFCLRRARLWAFLIRVSLGALGAEINRLTFAFFGAVFGSAVVEILATIVVEFSTGAIRGKNREERYQHVTGQKTLPDGNNASGRWGSV